MAFHAQINTPLPGQTAGSLFNKDITSPVSGAFTFRDRNTKLNKGDKLYYWLYVIYKGLGYHLENQVYEYRGDELQNHNIHFEDPNSTTEPTGIDVRLDEKPINCPLSLTMVNGKRKVCAGQEIFSEDFSAASLNTQKWTVEKRIAIEPDYEFVLYSNQSFVTGHQNGLRIEPQLLTQVYDERKLQSSLTVDDCTVAGEPMACSHNRLNNRALAPPIVSSQITTSQKFSFLFGRIEVVAKIPTGDWIYPQLWLQPQGFKYDKKDYKAGLVAIGMLENSPTGSSIVKQGVILGAEDPIRSKFLLQKTVDKNWGRDFHTFVLEWKPGEPGSCNVLNIIIISLSF